MVRSLGVAIYGVVPVVYYNARAAYHVTVSLSIIRYTNVTVSSKRMHFAQNLECKFYISVDSIKHAL